MTEETTSYQEGMDKVKEFEQKEKENPPILIFEFDSTPGYKNEQTKVVNKKRTKYIRLLIIYYCFYVSLLLLIFWYYGKLEMLVREDTL